MIDTDKYEGHSTGWKRKINHSTYSIINDDGQKVASVPCYEECNLDSELMADAPLLLAEVKRLNKENDKLLDIINEYEEVIQVEDHEKIERLEKRIEDMQKGAPRCSCPRISVNGNGGGGSIMVDVTFEDGEEYAGCLDRWEE